MRAHVQRVSRARVTVEGKVVAEIGAGAVVLLGVRKGDGEADARRLVQRCADLRFFPDERGNMNRSIAEVRGSFLVVSQFTLYADTRGGRRPSFTEAAPGAEAEPLYLFFCGELEKRGYVVARGVFGAMMDVELVNQGPVTLLLEQP
ncbi:MAG TPA: D-aminoacyl-tRNA deacylase [Candidatus Eisenbacteria bacterium]|nr:D-aminoacyl-tRNA deacylase [Candidatus Eisenbacteria bacterium]